MLVPVAVVGVAVTTGAVTGMAAAGAGVVGAVAGFFGCVDCVGLGKGAAVSAATGSRVFVASALTAS